jgi:DNA-directed RNA polymerase subunit N (RpoN/RPB10)
MAAQFSMTLPYCSCTTPFGDQTALAFMQREFEERIKTEGSYKAAMTSMGITRMCCRRTFLNLPKLFLDNGAKHRLEDETGLVAAGEGVTKSKSSIITMEGKIITPKRPFPPLA